MKIVLLILMMIVSGCATFSQEECRNMDWTRAGHISAMEGKGKVQGMKYYSQACFQEYGIAPDAEAFSAGHERGLKDFCSPENAYNYGARGQTYNNICPKELNEGFLSSYTKGLSQFNAKKIRDLERENRELEDEISSLKNKIYDLERENDDLKRDLRSTF